MTLHYHGTPITPKSVLYELAGKNFCVSYAAPHQVEDCHRIGQSVMLDNGAFTFWRRGGSWHQWKAYYEWCEEWLNYRTTWAVIPDVIDGTEEENDALLDEWPFGQRGAPVWHMHESLGRLEHLSHWHDRVCIGSSGSYKTVGSPSWHRRMEEAMNLLCKTGPPPVWVHMLRGMALSEDIYPFASVDSSDIAQNHHRPQNGARKMADRWDAKQCPPTWIAREQLTLEHQ